MNLSFLQEQSEILTIEPSLQPEKKCPHLGVEVHAFNSVSLEGEAAAPL